MSTRSSMPSLAQIKTLLRTLEEKRWLATGHSRTAYARDRTRQGWQDIATMLNSDGSGCVKTWQQWSKYWKDKKSATKRKASLIQAKPNPDVGADEENYLSEIDEQILALMGGERAAIRDRELEIDPFYNIQDVAEEQTVVTTDSESTLEAHIHVLKEELGLYSDECSPSPPLQEVQSAEPEPTSPVDDVASVASEPNTPRPVFVNSPTPAASPGPNARAAPSSAPRRRARVFLPRKRVIQHATPSEVTRLTRRLITIEERRTVTERILAENQREMVRVLRDMSEAWSGQSKTLLDLVQTIIKK